MSNAVISGSLFSIHDNCTACGGAWTRTRHPVHTNITLNVCSECEAFPKRLLLQKFQGKKCYNIRYNELGQEIQTVEQAIALSKVVKADMAAGTFSLQNYKKADSYTQGSANTTMEDFIDFELLKNHSSDFQEEERHYIRDFFAGYFCELNVLDACLVDVQEYIKDMCIKKDKQEWVTDLFLRVLDYVDGNEKKQVA